MSRILSQKKATYYVHTAAMSNEFSNLLNHFQKNQHKITEIENKISSLRISGEAGGGLVKAIVSGNKELVALDIDPSLIVAEEKKTLEDLIIGAIQIASHKAEEEAQLTMQSLLIT